MIDGRRTVKFEGVSPEHDHGFAWVDPNLRFIIKIEGASGDAMSLEHIVEGPQAAALFEVPADFKKVDPEAAAPPRSDK
jgi:hypothetical protein